VSNCLTDTDDVLLGSKNYLFPLLYVVSEAQSTRFVMQRLAHADVRILVACLGRQMPLACCVYSHLHSAEWDRCGGDPLGLRGSATACLRAVGCDDINNRKQGEVR
jgi:hypothetical protein